MTGQWAIPTIILMIFLIFTLISYNKTMQENAKDKALERVSRQAVSVAGFYRGYYEGVVKLTDAMADYLMTEDDIFNERSVETIRQIDRHTGLINAYIMKADGQAIDANGKITDNLDETEEFRSIQGT